MSHDVHKDPSGSPARLAQALARLPWTLGVWGLQQAVDLVNPQRSMRRSVRSLEGLSRSAQSGLEGPLKSLWETGDQLQTGLLDSAARLASGSWREPRSTVANAWAMLGRSWGMLADGKRGGKS